MVIPIRNKSRRKRDKVIEKKDGTGRRFHPSCLGCVDPSHLAVVMHMERHAKIKSAAAEEARKLEAGLKILDITDGNEKGVDYKAKNAEIKSGASSSNVEGDKAVPDKKLFPITHGYKQGIDYKENSLRVVMENEDRSCALKLKHCGEAKLLFFDQAHFHLMRKSILYFNDGFQKRNFTFFVLAQDELLRLEEIIHILEDLSNGNSPSRGFLADDAALLQNVLRKWPTDIKYCVIDILRMVVLHPEGLAVLSRHATEGKDIFTDVMEIVARSPFPSTVRTAIFFFTNLSKHQGYSHWLIKHQTELIHSVLSCRTSELSVMLHNFAILMNDVRGKVEMMILAAREIMKRTDADAETKYFVLVAVCLLLRAGYPHALECAKVVAPSAKSSNETEIVEVGAELESIVAEREALI